LPSLKCVSDIKTARHASVLKPILNRLALFFVRHPATYTAARG
jgi:hypothetical protein